MSHCKENTPKLSWSRRRSLRKTNKLAAISEHDSDFAIPFHENRKLQDFCQMPVRVLPVPQRACSMQNISVHGRPNSMHFIPGNNMFTTATKLKSLSQNQLNFSNKVLSSSNQERHYNTRLSVKYDNALTKELKNRNLSSLLRKHEFKGNDESESPHKKFKRHRPKM